MFKIHIEIFESELCRRIATLGGQIIKAPENIPFPRLTFAEAQELYYQRTGIDERQEPDLSPNAEWELCRYAQEVHGTDFIFIIGSWFAAALE